MPINYTYRARCQRVIDADTFVLDVDLGFNVRAHITVRLRGVNAPERNAPGGPEAIAWLAPSARTGTCSSRPTRTA